MKDVIKFNTIGFWEGFELKQILPEKILNRFDFELSSEPDFLFVSCFFRIIDICEYPNAIRIFFSGENVLPDFIFFDYFIGFSNLSFKDRYCEFQFFLYAFIDAKFCLYFNERLNRFKMSEKTFFCDFIYSHDRPDNLREKIFTLFSKYKRVESGGSYLNNQIDNKIVDYKTKDNSKFRLLSKCKFSLIIESTDCDGFTTEKIIHSISCNTIPIYFGTNYAKEIFSSQRVIFASDYETIEDLLEYVSVIDNNNELYVKYINSSPFIKSWNLQDKINSYETFLENIFVSKKCYVEKNYSPKKYYQELVFYKRITALMKKKIPNAIIRFFLHIFKKKQGI